MYLIPLGNIFIDSACFIYLMLLVLYFYYCEMCVIFMCLNMGQATHPLWPRLGITTPWAVNLGSDIYGPNGRNNYLTMLTTLTNFFIFISIFLYKMV